MAVARAGGGEKSASLCSNPSITSTDLSSLDAAMQEEYVIMGHILLGFWHERQKLFVRIIKANNLPGLNTYVKVYLLPYDSKTTKKKTAIKKHSGNPVFNEILQISLKSTGDQELMLWISVWNRNRYGKNLFLGECHLSLALYGVKDPTDRWYTLRPKEYKPNLTVRGQLIFSVMAHKTDPLLSVCIKQGIGLIKRNPDDITFFYVTVNLISRDLSNIIKKQSKDVDDYFNPNWDGDKIDFEGISTKNIMEGYEMEISVWSYYRYRRNEPAEVIGSVHLSSLTESNHWSEIMANRSQFVEACHDLRSSADKNPNTSLEMKEKESEEYEESESKNGKSKQFEESTDSSSIPEYGDEIHETEGMFRTSRECDIDYPITGRLLVRMECSENSFDIRVLQAEKLSPSNEDGICNSFVKIYVLKKNKKVSEYNTKVIDNSTDPVYNKQFEVEDKESALPFYSVIFTVWRYERLTKHVKFLGELKLKPVDFRKKTIIQWYNLVYSHTAPNL